MPLYNMLFGLNYKLRHCVFCQEPRYYHHYFYWQKMSSMYHCYFVSLYLVSSLLYSYILHNKLSLNLHMQHLLLWLYVQRMHHYIFRLKYGDTHCFGYNIMLSDCCHKNNYTTCYFCQKIAVIKKIPLLLYKKARVKIICSVSYEILQFDVHLH